MDTLFVIAMAALMIGVAVYVLATEEKVRRRENDNLYGGTRSQRAAEARRAQAWAGEDL